MMMGVKRMTDEVTQLMIPLRKTWNQLNGVGIVSEEGGERRSSITSGLSRTLFSVQPVLILVKYEC